MGEEQKEHEKIEQADKKVGAVDDKKDEEKKPDEPQEIVLKVEMHCEACAKNVEKSLLRFEGVENVKADSRSKTVVVKSRTADPVKVCERVQKKTKKRVELISPLPKSQDEEKKENPPAQEEKKKEPPKVITVILKVQMHCDACAQLLQKRIIKIEGVKSVVTDLPNDQVIVKGVMEPATLVENIQRKTRRPAVIVEEKKEEEKKPEEQEEEEEEEEEKKEDKKAEDDEDELKKYEYWPIRYYVEYVDPYPPETFSDENPNACTVV